jgi:hypothetical protein
MGMSREINSASLPKTLSWTRMILDCSFLLLASGLLANDRDVCVVNVNLATNVVARKHGAPQSRIHFAVGAVVSKNVNGYSGVQEWHVWKEFTQNLTSSACVAIRIS